MNTHPQRPENEFDDELIEAWLMAMEEPIDEARREELNQQIVERPHLRQRIIRLTQEQAWLMWHGSAEDESGGDGDDRRIASPRMAALSESVDLAEQRPTASAAPLPPGAPQATETARLNGKSIVGAPVAIPSDQSEFLDWFGHRLGQHLPSYSSSGIFGMAMCFLLGAAVAGFIFHQMANRQEPVPAHVPIAAAADNNTHERPTATLVSFTNCRWDKTRSTADLAGSGLKPGQSLHLLEGVAEIKSTLPSGSVGRFQLEGPLAMTLSDDGMPNLFYGKLSGEFSYRHDSFRLGTALGRIVISGNSSLGIRAAANEVELHVFSGAATLDVWSTSLSAIPNQLLKAEPGTSLRVRTAADGSISVDYGEASENRFITPASLAASQLLISDQYVKAIREAKPVAYWRFEDEVDGQVRNEMSDRFHLRMVGNAVRLRTGQVTRSAEFGIAAGPGYMISDDVFDGVINDDYTVELWAKPTCFHHGALFSLIDWTPAITPKGQHRVYLEFCGPRDWDYEISGGIWESDPGRLFFINRRSEVYSSAPYVVRKWQHLVALREGSGMKLYADGRLIATDENSEPLGSGMRVLMGQLFPPSRFMRDDVTARLYSGELDEVALYDRVLSEDEIRRHLELAEAESETAEAAPARDY